VPKKKRDVDDDSVLNGEDHGDKESQDQYCESQ
jgi:hypothetical protein